MKKLLIAAVMILAFSVAASAQALFQVGSTPVTSVASCGVAELTGDIVFTTAVGASNIVPGTITITYGVPITSVAGATVTVTDSAGTVIPGIAAIVAPAAGATQLVLTLNALPTSPTAPYTIRLSGVRVNVAGATNLQNLTATVTATGNAFVGGQTSVVVISSIASNIQSITVAAAQPALTVSSINPAGGTVGVTVKEGFFNAWVQGVGLTFTFAGVPAGATLSFPTTITTSANQVFSAATVNAAGTAITVGAPANITSTTSPAQVFYVLTTPLAAADTVVETVTLPVTVAFAGTPRPIAQGTITVSVNAGPPNPTGATLIPRFDGTTCQKGPVTIVTVATANTTLLIPFATTVLDYDTGIAIANTTKDALTTAANSAIVQNGKLTFLFFPQGTGAPFSYTTSSTSPGSGLASGVLNAGQTYVVALSELLAAAQGPADFQGYILVVADFTNAHGEYFVSNFDNFTHGALMLVVNTAGTPSARQTSPESLGN